MQTAERVETANSSTTRSRRPKRLVQFSAVEGGDSHCEPKALALRDQRILDWLDETVG